jgi:hypothetical protein
MPDMGFTEIGRPGLKHTSGIITEEFLTSLRGQTGMKVYREMRDNDPVVGAVLLAIQNLIRQADWKVEPASDADKDKQVAEFVHTCMHDLDKPWNEFISEALSMVVFGWSFFEVVYKRRRGNRQKGEKGSNYDDMKIGWKKLGQRAQDSLWKWELADNGQVLGLHQRPAPEYKVRYIPMDKGVLFRTVSYKNNPEGRSALRNAYRPWYFKKRIEEIEGVGIERDLEGLPTAWVPPQIMKSDASDEEKATLNSVEDMVKNVKNNEQAGLVLPSQYDEFGNRLFDFELLSSKGRRNFDTNAIVMRYSRILAVSMLADFVLIGHDNVGSFAMASNKTKVFSTAVSSYMDTIADQFNRRLIPELLRLNGHDGELPKLTHSDIETIELEQLAMYINALSGARIDLTGPDSLNYLEEQASMPTGSLEELEEELESEIAPRGGQGGDSNATNPMQQRR